MPKGALRPSTGNAAITVLTMARGKRQGLNHEAQTTAQESHNHHIVSGEHVST